MIFLEIETVFASKIWARYWGNLAGNPHWDLNWSRFAMWDCLLVFLQGGHSNYWRQTRRTIYCFPRCHWSTSPFYLHSSVWRVNSFISKCPGSWVEMCFFFFSSRKGEEEKREQNETIGRTPIIYTYLQHIYEFEHLCHPILASGTRSAPKSAFSRPVWILGGAAAAAS